VKTPSGGFHHYFTGTSAITTSKLGIGIDTPVMAPILGSNIKGKGEYKAHTKALPLSLPDWLKTEIGKHVEKCKDRDEVYIELDEEHNIDKAKEYLNLRALIAEEGDSGDAVTYKVACAVRDYGISKPKCLELMLEHYNERCSPPWSPEDLQKKVHNAYSYAQDPIGKNTAAMDFADSYLPFEESAFLSLEDTPIKLSRLKGAPPPREWIIEGLLPKQEVSVIYGDGCTGKSLLMEQMGLSVSSGGTFLNFPVLCQMPTLYVTCEDNRAEAHRRVHDILRAAEYDFMDFNAPFYISPRVGKSAVLAVQTGYEIKYGAFYEPLCQMIEFVGRGNEMLVILDTASDVFMVNENDRNAASFCVKTLLGGIIQKYGCTLLIVAHPSKSSMKNGVHDAGSTGWRNSVRSMLVLTNHENENLKNHRWLQQTKSNYSAKLDPIRILWEKGRFVNDSGDEIIDNIMEANTNIFLELVKEQCKTNPIGLHHSSKPYLHGIVINDAKGKPMDKDMKNNIVNQLILDKIIEERKGHSRGNGLWPVEMVHKEETL
jgi:RecA-family ATPase